MFKPTPRLLFRPSITRFRVARYRQPFSTAPPSQRSRSWKNSAVRWGLAIGGIYYYNTSSVFAEEPALAFNPPSSPTDEASIQTLESLSPSRKSKPTTNPSPTLDSPQTTISDDPLTLEGTEEQASQEGAFNEETGEINWDCPCLGGMAHGPCGEQFRTAFSCFVFSKEDPKGMDCIENFKGMQDCFREHPDVYGSELEDDEDDEDNAENHDPGVEPQVNEPSVFRPPPATSSTHLPEVDEPSIYQPPKKSAAPIHPQVDEPSKFPMEHTTTPVPTNTSTKNSTAP